MILRAFSGGSVFFLLPGRDEWTLIVHETEEMKIGIGGIKFSPELVQYTHHACLARRQIAVGLLRRLAEQRINLPFLLSRSVGDESPEHLLCRRRDCASGRNACSTAMACSAGGRNRRSLERYRFMIRSRSPTESAP